MLFTANSVDLGYIDGQQCFMVAKCAVHNDFDGEVGGMASAKGR
jgi:hypothetical protein